MHLKKSLCAILSLFLIVPSLSSCDKLDSFFDQAKSVGGDVWSYVAKGWDDVVSWGSGVWNHASDFANDSWSSVNEWGSSTWKSVADWSSNAGEATAQWGKSVIDGVSGFFCQAGDYVLSVRDKIVGFGLKKGVDHLDLLAPIQKGDGDWSKYKGDDEAITYSLFANQMAARYDVFPAKVNIPNSDEVYGYAFTDGTESYVYNKGQSDEETYLSTGFVSLVGELPISDEQASQGLEIERCDDTDASDDHYFYAFSCNPFDTHVVFDSTYLKYGVNSNHQLYYEAQDDRGVYDTSRGSLYSYNSQSFILGQDDGFIPTKGSVFQEAFDFEEWKSASFQSCANGFTIALQSLKNCVTEALTTVRKVIRNLESQTILGYSLNDVKAALSGVHEDDVATINNQEVAMHSVDNAIPTSGASDLSKWLVGIAVSMVLLVNLVMKVVFPALAPLAGATSGAAVETFMQVVAHSHNVKNLNWMKIGIASASGALIGACGFSAGEFSQTMLTSAVAGLTESLYRFLDGSNFLQCALSFISTFAISFVMIGVFKTLAKTAGKIVQKLAPNLSAKVSEAFNGGVLSIRGKVAVKVEGIKSERIRNFAKSVVAHLMGVPVGEMETLALQSVKSLPGDDNPYFVKTDVDGNILSKRDLLANGGNGRLSLSNLPDNPYQSLFVDKNGKPLAFLNIVNGKIQFENAAWANVVLSSEAGLVASRAKNFSGADRLLCEELIRHDTSIPSKVYDYFSLNGIDLSTLKLQEVKDMRSALGLTWHEGEDGYTLYLVETALHQVISHMGGFAYAKAAAVFNVPSTLLFLGA